MNLQDILPILEDKPEPEPLGERPLIVYAHDIDDPRLEQRLGGTKLNVYFTAAAVHRLVEKIQNVD